jgi:hypothetical protein
VLDTPLWSRIVVEKSALAETCTRYDVAPVEAFQVSVGFAETPVALFAGEESVGAAGGEAVVKLHTLDQALVPAAFVAFTRQ